MTLSPYPIQICYTVGMNLNEIPAVGSWWYAWGDHYQVKEHTTFDEQPALFIQRKGATKRDPCSVLAHLFVKKAVPSVLNKSRYTEGVKIEPAAAGEPSGEDAAADGSTDSTRKEVTMTTATKQKRKVKATARAAAPKAPTGNQLAADLLSVVREKVSPKVKLAPKTSVDTDGKVANFVENDKVLAHVRIFDNRVHVRVRENDKYARFTVHNEKDVKQAAAAVAAKAK